MLDTAIVFPVGRIHHEHDLLPVGREPRVADRGHFDRIDERQRPLILRDEPIGRAGNQEHSRKNREVETSDAHEWISLKMTRSC